MRFGFSEDQLQLTAAVRQLLDGELSPQVRGSAEAGARRGALWKALAEQGIFALLVPEEHDGLGLTELDAAGVLEELGRAAAPGPVAETAFIAPRLLAGSPEYLQALAAGQLAVAVTALPGGYAAHADVADLVVALAEEEVRAVPGDAAGLAVQPQVDQTRPLAAVPGGQGTVLATGADARELVAAAQSYGAVATAAQLVGAATRLLDDTIRYAGQRHQFGHPIGSFQAVKHQLADVAVAVAFARPLRPPGLLLAVPPAAHLRAGCVGGQGGCCRRVGAGRAGGAADARRDRLHRGSRAAGLAQASVGAGA